jgi:hypothetical protein
LNEDIPQPPLVSPMSKNFTSWKNHIQEKAGKYNQAVATGKEYISP